MKTNNPNDTNKTGERGSRMKTNEPNAVNKTGKKRITNEDE
jgi:hypothetical protein